jgi:hypothetical protein
MVSLVLSPGAQAGAAIHDCVPDDVRCAQTPAGSILASPEADSWKRRATEAVLAGHARELAGWSRDAVVVASNLSVRLPRRHRLVHDKAAGERALLACRKERLLLVVSQQEVLRASDGSVLADVQVELFGATCDRPERTIFEHGVDWYRVVFIPGRVDVLRTARLAI